MNVIAYKNTVHCERCDGTKRLVIQKNGVPMWVCACGAATHACMTIPERL